MLHQIYYNGNKLYERQENSAHYCAFSGGEPDCNIWYFHDNGNQWPGGAPISNGAHQLRARVRADSGQEIVVERTIMISGVSGGNGGNTIHAEIVQTGANNNDDSVSGALSFRVLAYDTAEGNDDGDGIDSVLLQVYYNGNKVHEREEGNAAYCAFGGGEPDCTLWVFQDHDNKWPDGAPVSNGPHLLRARVRADGSQQVTVERTVTFVP